MVSETRPPQTIAPRRPLPIGRASVHCSAGALKLTLRGFEACDDDPPSIPNKLDEFHKSLSVSRLTISKSTSSIEFQATLLSLARKLVFLTHVSTVTFLTDDPKKDKRLSWKNKKKILVSKQKMFFSFV